MKSRTIICRECGLEGTATTGAVCDDCLDERWPTELAVATTEEVGLIEHFDEEFFPEHEDTFLE